MTLEILGKLAGQNASPSAYTEAKERTQEIQAAYQLIKKSRQGPQN